MILQAICNNYHLEILQYLISLRLIDIIRTEVLEKCLYYVCTATATPSPSTSSFAKQQQVFEFMDFLVSNGVDLNKPLDKVCIISSSSFYFIIVYL